MLSKKMLNTLNEQIKLEMYSAHLYLAMSSHIEHQGFKGMAKWLRVQYEEETFHFLKFYDYVKSRGEKVILKAIDAPPNDFGTPLETFRKVLEHEQQITADINKLYKTAIDQNDFASQIFLQWFISEQVEEEDSTSEVLNKIQLIRDKPTDLLYLDKELGTRTFTPPSSNE